MQDQIQFDEPPPRVREAVFDDRPAVEELKERCGLMGRRSAELWQHIWVENPALRRFGLSPRPGWVLEVGGRIVGAFGSIPLLVRHQHRDLLAAVGNSLAVDPAYRGHSLKLITAFFRQPDVDLLLSTTTGEAARQVYSRLFRMENMPQEAYYRSLFWVINTARFADALWASRGSVAGRLGAAMATPLLSAERLVRGRQPRARAPGVRVRRIGAAEIGEEFDELWEEKSGGDPRLMAHRSAECLRWRYHKPVPPPGPAVLCATARGRLVGYTVLVPAVGRSRLRKMSIADVFVPGDRGDVLSSLLAASYEAASDLGCDVLEVIGLPPDVRQSLLAAKPYTRTVAAPGAGPYLYKAREPKLTSALKSAGAWYASANDGDEGF
jgi:hypothetical protein